MKSDNDSNAYRPDDVLEFWFPETGHENSPQTHEAFWMERMHGGMDVAIIERFAGLTSAAAAGQLDHWAESPRGRLALLIALDQFPRSLWRGKPAAYAQDIKATRLALEGIENGHFATLKPWEMTFFIIAICHCEGPDHLLRVQQLDPVVEQIIQKLPPQLSPMADIQRAQQARLIKIIGTYGRHPHRNDILGRPSTTAEEHYIATGDFPHLPREGGM